MSALASTACRIGRRAAAVPDNFRARRAVLARLAELDPEVDDHEITNLLLGRVFPDPWFHQALFTVSYYRQVAVRTIGPIIGRRGYGPTLTETLKRNDDTLLMFGFIYRDGYDSAAGHRTIDRLSAIHKTFDIRMDDYRYTIATLCYEPARIPEMLGVEALTKDEQRAIFNFWTKVGREWGVDIPEDQDAFRKWFHDYEQSTYERTKDAVEVSAAMEKCFLDRWAPGPLRPLGSQFLRALCDDHLLATVDMQPASPAMQKATRVAVDAYFKARRRIPGPAREDNIIRPWTKEYGRVPDSSEVGPTWSLEIQPEPRKCPI
jgi:hypothetical protein